MTIEKDATDAYIQTEFVSSYKKGLFYYAKFNFQNISDTQFDKITATCFVMDETKLVRKKRSSVLKNDKILSPKNTKMFEYFFLITKKDKLGDLKFHVIVEQLHLVESKGQE